MIIRRAYRLEAVKAVPGHAYTKITEIDAEPRPRACDADHARDRLKQVNVDQMVVPVSPTSVLPFA